MESEPHHLIAASCVSIPLLLLILDDLLQICIIDAPGFIHPPCDLIDVVAGVAQKRDHFFQLWQFQPDDHAVNGDATQIGAEIGHDRQRHFFFDHALFRF